MIRQDVLRDDISSEELPSYVQKKLDDMKVPTTVGWFLVSNSWTKTCTWILLSQSVVSLVPLIPTSTPAVQTLRTDLMLPDDHPAVQRDTWKRRSARIANAAKWLGLVGFFLVSWSDLFPVGICRDGFSKVQDLRPVSKKFKWIKRHRDWAKEHQASLLCLKHVNDTDYSQGHDNRSYLRCCCNAGMYQKGQQTKSLCQEVPSCSTTSNNSPWHGGRYM